MLKIFFILTFAMPTLVWADFSECFYYIQGCVLVKQLSSNNNCDETKAPGLVNYIKDKSSEIKNTGFFGKVLLNFCPETYNACVDTGGTWNDTSLECDCNGKKRQENPNGFFKCFSQEQLDCERMGGKWIEKDGCSCGDAATWDSKLKKCVCKNPSEFYSFDKGCIPDPAKLTQKKTVSTASNASTTGNANVSQNGRCSDLPEHTHAFNGDCKPDTCDLFYELNGDKTKCEFKCDIDTIYKIMQSSSLPWQKTDLNDAGIVNEWCDKAKQITITPQQTTTAYIVKTFKTFFDKMCQVTEGNKKISDDTGKRCIDRPSASSSQTTDADTAFNQDFKALQDAFNKALKRIVDDCKQKNGKISADGATCETASE
nr:hypothetical protein [Candidatus Enterousia merdequi]